MQRQRILIEGQVQGVGFRPFVYNLAGRLGVTGWVSNTSRGVIIEAQGSADRLERFGGAIVDEHPPLARPRIVATETIAVAADEDIFRIDVSQSGEQRQAVITPDAATCEDCRRELADAGDRRYRYPFINCVNCGPRYTIIFDIPYDRPNTTMNAFTMCEDCQREYDDPSDRRFHAQPNACGVCGPKVWLVDAAGERLECDDPMAETVRRLEEGQIGAVKGLGGFHLAVRADSDAAVAKLRERKYRKAKAFAIMVRDVEAARQLAIVDAATEKVLADRARPIVLGRKKAAARLSEQVAERSRCWGIMLPYTPIHTLLMQGDYPALVMTSGNNSDEPIESVNEGAVDRLDRIADFMLWHDREIYTSCDDSVVKVFEGRPLVLRRARGYVPAGLDFGRRPGEDILAVGAELKNTVALVKGEQAFLSQHIGDLKGAGTYESFVRTVEKLGALIGAQPKVVACDLHPALASTRYAESYEGVKLVRVQHHHAHIAAVMGEHGLAGPVAGLAMDGVGYGSDETVWGGEALAGWRDRFERWGYLQPVAQPGGDAASREPWRMAVSYLMAAYGDEQGLDLAKQFLRDIEAVKIEAVGEMVRKGVNAPLSSSLGRLFDAVSSLLGICEVNTYDAQAAIELEYVADEDEGGGYPVEIGEENGCRVWSAAAGLRALVADLQAGVDRATSAGRFHNFVADALVQLGEGLAGELGTDKVALAGGVFQNDIILTRVVAGLGGKRMRVYFNEKLPVNDGAISFGQAVVADAISKSKLQYR